MATWLEQIDPCGHRGIKGLRLVTAYGLAAILGIVLDRSHEFSGGQSLSYLAAGFALWASVSEGQMTRWLATRDLAFLSAAAVVGALMFVGLSSIPIRLGLAGPEWILITGAFLVGYLKRFWNPRCGGRLPNLYRSAPCIGVAAAKFILPLASVRASDQKPWLLRPN